MIKVYNNLSYTGQNLIVKKVETEFYDITCDKIIFLVKLYEICYQKKISKFKDSLQSIVSN